MVGELPPDGQVEVSDELTPGSWSLLVSDQVGERRWWLDPEVSPSAYYRVRQAQVP